MRVLVVCTANRYRSPAAEHLLRAAATTHMLDWAVGSCGLAATEGEPMGTVIGTFLRQRGIDPDSWRSRRLARELVERADLILAVDESQRSTLAERYPESIRQTFLLRQFARYAARLPGLKLDFDLQTPDGLLEAVREARAHVQPVPTHKDEIADPAGRSARRIRASAAQVSAAVDTIVESVSAASRPASERASR